MHCDSCNIDFPTGLRFCKWCGQALTRPRTTSELHACPVCADPIQPGWAFCKACGAKLNAPAEDQTTVIGCPNCGTPAETGALVCVRCGEDLKRPASLPRPARGAPSDTALIAHCGNCGDLLEPETLYCKGCGAPTYGSASPFGPSSLLCAACNGRSPLGSTACRVCGAPLDVNAVVPAQDDQVASPKKRNSNTLADLGEHHPAFQNVPQERHDTSGANTFVFKPADVQGSADATTATIVTGSGPEIGHTGDHSRRDASTTVLVGAGNEEQTATAIIEKPRTTSPVESSQPPAPPGDVVAERAIVVADDSTMDFGVPTGLPDVPAAVSISPAAESSTVVMGSERVSANTPSQPHPSERSIPPPPLPAATVPNERPLTQPTTVVVTGRQRSKAGVATAAPVIARGDVDLPASVSAQSPNKKSHAAAVSAVVVLVLLGVSGYFVWWFVAGGNSRPSQRVEAPVPATPVDQPVPPRTTPPPASVAPEGMVLVPGGSYVIGREDGDPIEKPQHSVELKPFLIDRTEVTNADYQKFLAATGHAPPSSWVSGTFPPGQENWPVVMVSWNDAADYAVWAGKRLPTEYEWEAAARGKEGLRYPWGNDWDPSRANISAKSIANVGQHPEGASPSGALDMVGNVWEWTASEFDLYPGSTEKTPSTIKAGITYKIIRGGAYDGKEHNDGAYRGYVDANKGYDKTGFRLAKNIPVSGL